MRLKVYLLSLFSFVTYVIWFLPIAFGLFPSHTLPLLFLISYGRGTRGGGGWHFLTWGTEDRSNALIWLVVSGIIQVYFLFRTFFVFFRSIMQFMFPFHQSPFPIILYDFKTYYVVIYQYPILIFLNLCYHRSGFEWFLPPILLLSLPSLIITETFFVRSYTIRIMMVYLLVPLTTWDISAIYGLSSI